MTPLSLQCHPDTPASDVRAIAVAFAPDRLVFRVLGADALVVPPLATPERTDGLWQHTCFELFVKPDGGSGYTEFNFAPSTRWAAYRFDGYRAGMRALDLAQAPQVAAIDGDAAWQVALPAEAIGDAPVCIGLSAVIEETGGRKSYWALAHPPGKPDFHHEACFAHRFAAGTAP